MGGKNQNPKTSQGIATKPKKFGDQKLTPPPPPPPHHAELLSL